MITESILRNNTAKKGKGGAIYDSAGSGESRIEKSSIIDNKANLSGGGAIYHNTGVLKIFNCEISNNEALKNIVDNEDYLNVFNSSFHNNHALSVLGNNGELSKLTVYASEFIDNRIVRSAIFNNGRFCSVEKAVFQNNLTIIKNRGDLTLISPVIREQGRTISNDGYILLKKSPNDISTKISGKGRVEFDEEIIPDEEKFDFGYLDGIIHGIGSDESVFGSDGLDGSVFDSDGSNVALDKKAPNEIVLNEDIVFESYELDFYSDGIELDIDNLVIDGNGKTIDGGDKSRIFIVTGNNITLKNITFKNGHSHKNYDNPLNNHGGAIKVNHNAKLRIENCLFLSNYSEVCGGAIENYGNLTIIESLLKKNLSHRYGGAIINWGELTIMESALTSNSVESGYAGAIMNYGDLTIKESTINKNESLNGVLYNKGDVTINDSNFADNRCYNSGAIENYGKISIMKSTFENNISENIFGGAINNSGEVTIEESIFRRNLAAAKGGAIFNFKKLTVIESVFEENKAKKNGGAIFNQDELRLVNCDIKNNKPDNVFDLNRGSF